jgi:inner membrane protein
MDPVTHVATGALLSQLIPAPSPVWGSLAGIAFAWLPDADYVLMFSDRLAFIRHHRSLSHSLAAVLLFPLLAAGAAWALGGSAWFKPILCLGLAAMASHLIMDLATSYGTQLLFPFSRRRFTLDWLFIIDPYFTGLLLAGAVAVGFRGWGHLAGALLLAAAGGYLLLCCLYHRQALALARQIFPPPVAKVAAQPQPFSCRRWQLLGAQDLEVQQAFVQLPFLAFWGFTGRSAVVSRLPGSPGCRAPVVGYRPPQDLQVQVWSGLVAPALGPEARKILGRYLEFARFPLLRRVENEAEGLLLEWLDLRFSVPGRAIPFALQLRLDARGGVRQWRLGRRGGEAD